MATTRHRYCSPTRRRFRASGFAGWTLLLCSGLTMPHGAEPETDIRREVEQHVEALGSESRAARAEARRALEQLGPPILDLLPPPDLVKDAAARDALRQIRRRLERAAAEQSVQATRITLPGSTTIAEFAAAAARQTANVIDVGRLDDDVLQRPIGVDCRDAAFWTCLEEVTASTGLNWTYSPESAAIVLERAAEGDAPAPTVAVEGAFHVAVGPATLGRGVVRVPLRLSAEPRMRPLYIAVADADFEATVGAVRLAPFSPRAVTELPMSDRGPARFAVLFHAAGAPDGAKLTVRGRVTVHVAAAPHEVRFVDLSTSRPVSRRCGGVTVTLQRARAQNLPQEGTEVRARLSVAYDSGGPEFESHRTWLYHNEVWLEDPEGQRFAVNQGFDVTAQADGGAEIEYRFGQLPDRPLSEWTLVYVAPTLLIDVPVQFAVDDVAVAAGNDD